MCLIVFAYNCHPDYSLILGANRDEYRDRPAEQARFWPDAPHILAGRDRQAGGTWLGVTTDGKLAAVTNYRDPRQQVVDPPSRGKLVADFLQNPLVVTFIERTFDHPQIVSSTQRYIFRIQPPTP
jgi:uncharacterized protein with NRDE domain